MKNAIDGDLRSKFDRVVIVDSRFDYEYEGGHIKNAININHPKECADTFFGDNPIPSGPRTLVLVHCEFSSHRGPKVFRYIRKLDTQYNISPNLAFPEMYLIQGGYKDVFHTVPVSEHYSISVLPLSLTVLNSSSSDVNIL